MTINEFQGLAAAIDAAKSPALSSARNVRYRDGVPRPTKRHVKLTRPGSGVMQGAFIAGSILGVVQGGIAYYRSVFDTTWNRIADWPSLSANARRVYFTPVSEQTNADNREMNTDVVVKSEFNAGMIRFPRLIVVQDGINPPNLVTSTGTAFQAGTYETWSKTRPLYVPIGTFGAFTMAKYFVANGQKLLHSVSGRPTDFVVNLDASGNKGGDAASWCFVPSYNDMTAVVGTPDGNVICATLYSMTLMEATETMRFGEPYLWPRELFPIGAVSDVCFTNINGSIAFVSQTGIHTFNEGSQLRQDSNNTALSASIRKLMVPIQSNRAAAIRFDDYALFAIDTVYGRGIVVYDTNTNVFVSIDDCPVDLKQFALLKLDGVERLFFITDDDIYEAYAGESNRAVLQYGPYVGDSDFSVSQVQLSMRDAKDAEVSLTIYEDNEVSPVFTGKTQLHRNFDIAAFYMPKFAGRALRFEYSWENAGLLSITNDLAVADATKATQDGSPNVREKYLILGGNLNMPHLLPGGAVFDAAGLYLFDGPPSDHLLELLNGEEYHGTSDGSLMFYLKGAPGAVIQSKVYYIKHIYNVIDRFHSANVLAAGAILPAIGRWLRETYNINLRTGAQVSDISAEFWNQVAKRPVAYVEETELLRFEYINPHAPYGPTSLQAKRHRVHVETDKLMTVVFAPAAVDTDEIAGGAADLRWNWRNDVGLVVQPVPALELLRANNRMHVSPGTLLANSSTSGTAGRADIYATTGYWTLEVHVNGGTLVAYDLEHRPVHTHNFGRR